MAFRHLTDTSILRCENVKNAGILNSYVTGNTGASFSYMYIMMHM